MSEVFVTLSNTFNAVKLYLTTTHLNLNLIYRAPHSNSPRQTTFTTATTTTTSTWRTASACITPDLLAWACAVRLAQASAKDLAGKTPPPLTAADHALKAKLKLVPAPLPAMWPRKMSMR